MKKWIGALAAALLLSLLLWRSQRPLPTVPAEEQATARRSVPSFNTTPATKPPAIGVGDGPVIEELTVEKPEVCEGEENLVTVKVRPDDPFAHAVIAGHPGMRVVVRGNANPRVAGQSQVIVFGKDQKASVAEVPAFVVKACKVDHQLFVATRALPNRDAEVELTARVDPFGASAPFKATRFEWEFGDGASDSSSGPTVVHDFSHRPQERLRSELLVRVTAVDGAGARVTGRTTVELLNPSFESLREKGVVKIYADLEPRYPAAGQRQRVTLWHPYKATVLVERLRRIGGSGDVPVPAIHPGENVVLPPLDGDGDYLIEGKTEDGFRAVGNFSLMAPPAPPTRAVHQGVSAVQTAKIVRARELLGQASVTDEDIWRLEREGKMKDLAVGSEPSAQNAPPKDQPPRR